jgi:chromosome segregation ATPase
MTPKQINDLKKEHNAIQEQGQDLYAKVMELHDKCLDLQGRIQEAEGPDYDPIPLIFGAGFRLDPDL